VLLQLNLLQLEVAEAAFENLTVDEAFNTNPNVINATLTQPQISQTFLNSQFQGDLSQQLLNLINSKLDSFKNEIDVKLNKFISNHEIKKIKAPQN